MLSSARTAARWLTTVVDLSSRLPFTRSSLRRSCLRPSFVVCLVVVVLVAALVWTVMFSSWNVCRPDLDDDVGAQMADTAASLSTRSARRPAKICLSPLTAAGIRVNISLDSDSDLRR